MLLERCNYIQLDGAGPVKESLNSEETSRMGAGSKAPEVIPLTSDMKERIRVAITQLSSHGTTESGAGMLSVGRYIY